MSKGLLGNGLAFILRVNIVASVAGIGLDLAGGTPAHAYSWIAIILGSVFWLSLLND